MRNKSRSVGKKSRFVTPKDVDNVLGIMRHMPLFKRIKLAAWLVSYNIITVLAIVIISGTVAIHYVR